MAEIDIAPQFGAELKVGSATYTSTMSPPQLTWHVAGWLQACEFLGNYSTLSDIAVNLLHAAGT